ncbi:MAG: hypothetical protein ACOX5G_06685 [Kiritimatiellia bacterium]
MKTPSTKKAGVALLVVVGMLALLMISAVAFTSMMRIERSGASNFRHAITAREMAAVAVGRFIGDIDGAHLCNEAIVADDVYPGWTNDTWIIPGSIDASGQENVDERTELTDIPEDIVFSLNAKRKEAAAARVLTERMMKFVPGAFRPDVARVKPEWVPLEVDGRVVGRYAYIAINTSGMLDINAVNSNGMARAIGADPGEIRIGGLSDVTDATKHAGKRDQMEGFVTLEQVAALDASGCGLDGENLENFGIFSYIPSEELVPAGLEADNDGTTRNPKVYVGDDFPARFASESDYTYGDGRNARLQDRVWEILERDDMLGANFVGSDNQTTRIQGYLDALFDYIDPDDIPRNTAAPHVENTAMINGISFVYDFAWVPVRTGTGANLALQSGSKFIHEMMVTVSARNPFGTGTADYSAEVTLTRHASAPTINLSGITPASTIPFLTPKMLEGLHGMLVPAESGYTQTLPLVGDNTAISGDFTFASTGGVAAAGAKIQPTSRMTIAWDGGYRIDITVKLYHGADLVDQVEFKDLTFMTESFNNRLGGSRPIMNPIPIRNLTDRDTEWFETFDARFNWIATDLGARHMNTEMNWASGSDLAYFGITAPDFGGAGMWAEYILTKPELIGAPGAGAVLRLFDGMGRREGGATWSDELQYLIRFPKAKNAPLESVGEMALIPVAPYYTPRLYDHKDAERYSMVPETGYHRFYDFFTLRDPNETTPLKGLVNPNTRQPEVMTAVYNDMPVNEWEAAPARLTTAEAIDIGELVAEQLGGAAQDVSDIGAVDWLSVLSSTDALKEKFHDEARREAVIRNAAGLFSTRQQSFLVLLRADAFTTKFGQTSIRQGNVLSTAQAVALVWRDPVADKNGYHPCFIQMLKILTDDEDN